MNKDEIIAGIILAGMFFLAFLGLFGYFNI